MNKLTTSVLGEPLEKIIERIDDVTTLPQIAMAVMQVAQDPKSTVADLAQVIQGDAALSTKVLRTVNSARYAVRETITDLNHAISYLGLNEIRNIAFSASASKNFKSEEEIGTYRRVMLWRHLVSVGLCARLIARRCQFSNFEDAFLCGLLHDLGIIIEDQYVHEQFCRVIQSLTEEKTLVQAEREKLGFDHTHIAYLMAKKWNFSEVIQAALRFHHSSQEYEGEGHEIVKCVEVANFLCTAKGISSVGMRLVRPQLEVVQSLKMNKEDLKVLLVDLDEELARNESMFEML